MEEYTEHLYKSFLLSFLTGYYHAQKLTGKINLSDSFKMKFEEAIDHLKSMIPIKKEEFNKLSAHLKYRAFTIAKVSSEDLINKVKQIYTKTLEQGKTKTETLQEVHKILPNLTANHLSTHYNNNVMIAYNAGRIRHFKESSAVQYLMYNAILDGHTTNLCRKLHGTVKPKDDSFWDKFYPPNHHNCRSVVYPVHKSQLGKSISYIEAEEDTGKLHRKEIKIKPSKLSPKTILKDAILSAEFQFRGNPEKAIYEIPDTLIDRAIKHGIIEDLIKTAKNYFCKINLSTEDECEENLKKLFGFTKPKTEEFKNWINKILKSNFKAKGEIKNIGWIEKTIREKVKELMNHDLEYNPIIAVNDKGILHILRDAKKGKGTAILDDLIYEIPHILEKPEAILLDTQDKKGVPALLYIKSTKDKKAKFVIKLSRTVQVIEEGKRKKVEVNLLTTAGLVDITNLKSQRYIILKGKLE
ncbi:phage head morphogenesis protein [Persephonella sp.]